MVRKSEIQKVIQDLLRDGIMPTQRSVRERLGKGSMRDIAPVISEWKEGRKSEIPAKVKRLIDAYQRLSPVDQQILRMETNLKEITAKEKRRRGR